VLTGDVVISCGVGGAGTASEIALALKAGKPVVLLGASEEAQGYFKTIGRELVHVASTPAEAVQIAGSLFVRS
jgi:predicted Rossmann-fold nucleotide-binding protein